MKRGASIVSVGDELLSGRILDTNARLLSTELRAAGFPVASRRTVGDDVSAIADAVRRAREEAAVVVVTGGIGPTKDDLTRDGVALALGVSVATDPRAVAMIAATYARLGRAPHAGGERQAEMPLGCDPVENRRGTAPGILKSDADGVLFVAPGVPSELAGMLDDFLLPLLSTRPERGPAPRIRFATLAGVPEAAIGRIVADLMERGRDPVVGSYPSIGRVVLSFESSIADEAEAERRLDADLATVRSRFADAFVADRDAPLNEAVVRMLIERGLTIAVAESLTGGLIADGVVEVPGASATFLAGFATYANAAKVSVLGVASETFALGGPGAVSEECVRAMAEGARRVAGSDLALATSGIAGPSGGSEANPVGTTWFALADAAGTVALRQVFLGERAAVRRYARERAFDLLRRRLDGLPLVTKY